MQKGIKMIVRERDLIGMIFGNPREYRKSILYFSASGLCVGLAVLFHLVA
jgi:hypothetical protein